MNSDPAQICTCLLTLNRAMFTVHPFVHANITFFHSFVVLFGTLLPLQTWITTIHPFFSKFLLLQGIWKCSLLWHHNNRSNQAPYLSRIELCETSLTCFVQTIDHRPIVTFLKADLTCAFFPLVLTLRIFTVGVLFEFLHKTAALFQFSVN